MKLDIPKTYFVLGASSVILGVILFVIAVIYEYQNKQIPTEYSANWLLFLLSIALIFFGLGMCIVDIFADFN